MAKYSVHLSATLLDGIYLMTFNDRRSLGELAKAATDDGFLEITGRREIQLGKTSGSATGDCVIFQSQIVTLTSA